MKNSSSELNNGTERKWFESERSRYFLSISALNDVPLKVGTLTRVPALVTASMAREPMSMSSTTRRNSTTTQSSDARTVAERGENVRHVISPKSSPAPRTASGLVMDKSTDASMGMNVRVLPSRFSSFSLTRKLFIRATPRPRKPVLPPEWVLTCAIWLAMKMSTLPDTM